MGGRLASWGEGLLLVAVVASPWAYGAATDSARYVLCASALLAAALALPRAIPLQEAAATAALPLLGVVQVVLGISVAPVWTAEAVLVLAAMLGVMLMTRARAADPQPAIRIAAVVVLAGATQAAFGAFVSAGPPKLYGSSRPDVTMPFGSFPDHNHFAGFVEMAALLSAGLALGHARRARRVTPASLLSGAGALALAAAHLGSRSRGGAVALAGGTAVLAMLSVQTLFRSETRKSAWLRAAAASFLAAAFVWLAVSPAARQRLVSLTTGRGDASRQYREALAWSTIRLGQAHPLLGSGLGAYEDAVPPFKSGHGEVRATHAESDLLELFAEAGLLGLAAAAWLAADALARFGARLAPRRDPLRKGMAIGAMSGACTLAIHSMFDFNLRIPSNALEFAVLLGLATAHARDAPPPPADVRPVVPAVFAALAVAAAWRAHAAFAFERIVNPAEPNASIERLDPLLREHPYLAEAWRQRGLAWRQLGTPPSALREQRLDRAETDLAQALRLRAHWGEAWADRGWVKAMRGDVAGARADLARAQQLDPTHPGILLYAAEFERVVSKGVQR